MQNLRQVNYSTKKDMQKAHMKKFRRSQDQNRLENTLIRSSANFKYSRNHAPLRERLHTQETVTVEQMGYFIFSL